MAAFPPNLPDNLDDREAIVANDWAAYSGLTALDNHWARTAWPDGAQAVYWLVDLSHQAAIADITACCQAALATDEHLSLVERGALHITMCRAGTPGDVNVDALESAARDRVGGGGGGPVALTVGPLAGSPGAVRFTVAPWTRLLAIQSALADLAGEGVRRDRRPHVSIAYNGVRRPAAPVIDVVAGLRQLRPVTIDVTRLDLVVLRRDGFRYRWSGLGFVDL